MPGRTTFSSSFPSFSSSSASGGDSIDPRHSQSHANSNSNPNSDRNSNRNQEGIAMTRSSLQHTHSESGSRGSGTGSARNSVGTSGFGGPSREREREREKEREREREKEKDPVEKQSLFNLSLGSHALSSIHPHSSHPSHPFTSSHFSTSHPFTTSKSDPFSTLLTPPANESPEARTKRLEQEAEARRISEAIDEEIRIERGKVRKGKIVRVLLLGQSESGKSTTLRQFQRLYTPSAFREERILWRSVIQLNLVRSVRTILDVIQMHLAARARSKSMSMSMSDEEEVGESDVGFNGGFGAVSGMSGMSGGEGTEDEGGLAGGRGGRRRRDRERERGRERERERERERDEEYWNLNPSNPNSNSNSNGNGNGNGGGYNSGSEFDFVKRSHQHQHGVHEGRQAQASESSYNISDTISSFTFSTSTKSGSQTKSVRNSNANGQGQTQRRGRSNLLNSSLVSNGSVIGGGVGSGNGGTGGSISAHLHELTLRLLPLRHIEQLLIAKLVPPDEDEATSLGFLYGVHAHSHMGSPHPFNSYSPHSMMNGNGNGNGNGNRNGNSNSPVNGHTNGNGFGNLHPEDSFSGAGPGGGIGGGYEEREIFVRPGTAWKGYRTLVGGGGGGGKKGRKSQQNHTHLRTQSQTHAHSYSHHLFDGKGKRRDGDDFLGEEDGLEPSNGDVSRTEMEEETELEEGEGEEEIDEPSRVLWECKRDLNALWGDGVVREVLRRRKVRLEERPGFFLDDIERVTSLNYMPTDDDVLKARLKTVGVSEHRFHMEAAAGRESGTEWRIVDVGGSRSQRPKWIPYFEDVNAIIFLAPISGFDQVLSEDRSVNRLEDSVLLWKMICSNKLLANVELVLFLNKCDILDRKLKAGVRLARYVKSFGERTNDAETVQKYFRAKFAAIQREHSPNPRKFYGFCTSVTEIITTSGILVSVRDIVIREHLKRSKLL